MTYNQVQSFQINDYYVDIEITGCGALYSKSVACRGTAGLISWFGTAWSVDCFKSVFDCYIRVYQSFNFYWQGTVNFWLVQSTFGWPTLGYIPETRLSANLQDFRSLFV